MSQYIREAARLLVGLFAFVTTAAAQVPWSGGVSGKVIDAESGMGLPEVVVVLEPSPAGALPTIHRGSSAVLQSTRSVLTGAEGRYHFADLVAGTYRLRFQRMGYRSTTLEVELHGAEASQVSVGLALEPVILEPVSVTASGANPYTFPEVSADPGAARVAAERLRRARYLSGDVRMITHADVVEGVTLGETDLFRALQRLPGVSAGDEYSAELWIRGAPWDQTRVYFDDLPLFNPVHALGLLSGVNSDAVGAAFLHPGVQPVSLGGGGAGVLELRSRAGGTEPLRGVGEVSLASSRLALDGSTADGETRWMVSGRRTYLDFLTALGEQLLGRDKMYRFPGRFYDLTARLDQRLGTESVLEVSGTFQRDAISRHSFDDFGRTVAGWGGGALRATWDAPLGSLRMRQSVGFSGLTSSVERWADRDNGFSEHTRPPELPASGNRIHYGVIRGEWEPRIAEAAPPLWSTGYELVAQSVDFSGPAPTPFRPLDPEAYTLDRDEQLVRGALWGQRRWKPSEALSIEAGLRIEAARPLLDASALRLAPRFALRYGLSPELSLSAAVGRSFQYAQAIAPAGPDPQEGFHTEHLWVLAGDSVPAIRSDIATLGAEAWLPGSWLATATVFGRRSAGVVAPHPLPGSTLDRPLFATGENIARGIELSARRLLGRWTASVAYTFTDSELRMAGLEFPAPGDQRHVVDATALWQVYQEWRVGAAFTAASGTPYTRTFQGEIDCWTGTQCSWAEEPWQGDPNAFRTGPYQSLDLLTEWTRPYRNWTLGVYVQLRNALNHPNPGRYLGYGGEYCVEGCEYRGTFRIGEDGEIIWIPLPDDYRTERRDEFVRGLPTIPLLGLRVTF